MTLLSQINFKYAIKNKLHAKKTILLFSWQIDFSFYPFTQQWQ